MDDFVCWAWSRSQAVALVRQARDFLHDALNLTLKATVQVNRSARGLPICGYRVFPGTIRLAPSRRQRYLRAKRHWERLYGAGALSARGLQAGFAAALAITAHAEAAAWRRQGLAFAPALWYEDV